MPRLTAVTLSGIAIAVLTAVGTASAVTGGDETPPAIGQADADLSRPEAEAGAMPHPAGPATAGVKDARRPAADALNGADLRIPPGWEIVYARKERHDDRHVTVIRHQPDGYRLGGPHASLVLDADGTILGFTRLRHGDDGPLPDRRSAEEITLRFLRQSA
ncbi:MAG: hypothetical protein K0R62_8408 [Nonomuraea muscovyensis]|nr:hypothetical protein [Nonomuraea muscovyensis]